MPKYPGQGEINYGGFVSVERQTGQHPGQALLVRQVEAALARATGRRYQIKVEALDAQSLRELLRLLADLDYEQRAAVTRARREPWRR